MKPPITEADWRAFVRLKAHALDRYVEATLAGAAELARVTDGAPDERYRALRRYLAERDRVQWACFAGHSRSRAPMQLLCLVGYDVIAEDELAVFGDALRASVTSRRPALDPGPS